MDCMNGIPGNFIDTETGEALEPVYKWQDSMGYWCEKPVALCSWGELYRGYINIWNLQMSQLTITEDKTACKQKFTALDALTIFCYIFTAISIMSAFIVLVVAYFGG